MVDIPALPAQPVWDFSLADADHIIVYDYELPDGEVQVADGRVVAAPVAGIIAVPEGDGPHPLVIAIHGAHPGGVRERRYAGFDYLVQQLAAEGFAAISINMTLNYTFVFGEPAEGEKWARAIFDYHLAALAQANAGDDPGFGLDLTGRIDLERIHLIGHSRGGEVVNNLAWRDADTGEGRIRSLLHVAPTVVQNFTTADDPDFNPNHDPLARPFPDLPTAIILPEFDGDVPNEGQRIFDEILAAGVNESFAIVVFLSGANHNFFNRAFLVDDRYGALSFADPDNPRGWLDREQQEDFLLSYAVAFLAVVTGEREVKTTFASVPQPTTMGWAAATVSTYLPGHTPLIAEPSPEVALTAYGPARVAFARQGFPRDPNVLFNHPGVLFRPSRSLPLYSITWDDAGAAAAVPLTPGDLTGHLAISLYLALDSADERNPWRPSPPPVCITSVPCSPPPVVMVVTLIDETGEMASVAVNEDAPALYHRPGHIEVFEGFDESITEWLGWTPLGELRIPLDLFDGVDLATVTAMQLTFPSSSGAIMLSAIYAVG